MPRNLRPSSSPYRNGYNVLATPERRRRKLPKSLILDRCEDSRDKNTRGSRGPDFASFTSDVPGLPVSIGSHRPTKRRREMEDIDADPSQDAGARCAVRTEEFSPSADPRARERSYQFGHTRIQLRPLKWVLYYLFS